ARESLTLIHANTRKNDVLRDVALTGPPAYASARLIPSALRNVLLPAIFDPVMIAILLSPSRSKSLVTLWSQRINGWPIPLATNAASPESPAGMKSGVQYSWCSQAKFASDTSASSSVHTSTQIGISDDASVLQRLKRYEK